MIKKIKSIKNLAVFKDFIWDNEVKDSEGNIREFLKNNIIYGRNYSGKTTLSRIVRAMEKGSISDKYENPECCTVVDENDNEVQVTESDFTSHAKTIRVFNEDFVSSTDKCNTNNLNRCGTSRNGLRLNVKFVLPCKNSNSLAFLKGIK